MPRIPAPNRDLGPCEIVWDPNGNNVRFIKTFGGVFFRYEELRASIKDDQHGETDIDEVTIGATLELEVNLTREEIANLVYCFANAASGSNYLRVSNPVGEDVFASAQEVQIKPIVDGVVSTDTEDWIHIHRAFPRITMEQAYDNSGQRTTKTIFKGFPDDASPRLNELWRMGPAP